MWSERQFCTVTCPLEKHFSKKFYTKNSSTFISLLMLFMTTHSLINYYCEIRSSLFYWFLFLFYFLTWFLRNYSKFIYHYFLTEDLFLSLKYEDIHVLYHSFLRKIYSTLCTHFSICKVTWPCLTYYKCSTYPWYIFWIRLCHLFFPTLKFSHSLNLFIYSLFRKTGYF